MHGLIHDLFFSGRLQAELGYLVSDEQDMEQAGGRKNLFSKGGIYWSDGTGPIPVSGDVYLQYETLGESGWIGLPLGRAQALGWSAAIRLRFGTSTLSAGTPTA